MADLGELSARITAQIQEFERGMDQASGKIDDFSGSAERGGRRAGRGMAVAGKAAAALSTAALAAVAAAAAAGAALVALGARGMKAGDEQAKLARQLGITNEELATLQRAAEFAGMSSSQLTTNMQRLNRSLGEAMQGTGQAGEAFQQLGLDVHDLQQMGADEQMAAIASAMQGLGSRAEQAAVSAQIFGRSGQEMLVFLDDAEANLERANTQVNAFGIALSEVETDRIETANDALSSIGAVIQGIANRIAARVAPLVEFLALKFEEVAIETQGFQGVVDGVFNFVIRAAGFVADAIEAIRRAWVAVQHAAQVMGNIVIQVFAAIMNGISSLVDGAIAQINNLIDSANKLPFLEIERVALMSERAFMQAINRMADESTEAVRESRENMDEMMGRPWPGTAVKEFLDGLGEVEKAQREIAERGIMPPAGVVDEETGEARDFEDELNTLREFVMSEEELERRRHSNRLTLLQEALEAQQIAIEEFHELTEDLEEQHMERLNDIRERGLSEMERFTRMSFGQQTAIVGGELAALTRNLDRENKAQFAIMKAGAISQALINTYTGITRSLSAYPMPLAGIMAAAHAAAGFAQVANIRNQSFGSGGGGASSPAAAPASPPEGEQSRNLLVSGDFDSGQLFTGGAVRQLMDRISEAQKDGYTVVMA